MQTFTLTFSPIRSDEDPIDTIEVDEDGKIIINGFENHPHLLADDLVLLPISAEATDEARFPDPVVITAPGPVHVPR